jgi:hypothetical protein
MTSAFECFQHAARYEELAKTTGVAKDRAALLETAQEWSRLGSLAKAYEARKTRDAVLKPATSS